MKTKELRQEVELPESVSASVDGRACKVKGEKGELQNNFSSPRVDISVEGNKIVLKSTEATKREKRIMFTYAAHLRNMVKGVSKGHMYKLRVCSGHFPMNVSITNGELVVKNFLGEKIPRKVKFKSGVDAKLEGDILTLESVDKDAAGQTAADIEQGTRITNRDRRIFQDGIFIINKPKDLE